MKYVFFTGMGRSGTKFTSELFKLDKSLCANHEFIGDREYKLLSWYLGNDYCNAFLRKEKEKIDAYRQNKIFVDVNGELSDSVASISSVFDQSKVYHLVRNPRKVILSLLIRRDDNKMHKLPKDKNGIDAWMEMSKLEQICTNWVQTTETLLAENTELIQFEKLISDYQYVKSKILDPCGIAISENEYDEIRSKKINKTRSVTFRYIYSKLKGKGFDNRSIKKELAKEEEEQFLKICRPTMKKLGYE